MVKLQHRIRRDGIISVGGTQYKLDADGCVEVTDEHAAKLRQGSMWLAAGTIKTPVMPEVSQSGARRPRTKEEMMAAAEAFSPDVVVAKNEIKSSPMPSPMPSPVTADVGQEDDAEEVIEINSSMKKAELIKIAKRLDLNVDGKTKQEILELLETVNQE